MNRDQIKQIHKQILEIYLNQLQPIFAKYFNNEQNDSEVKHDEGFTDTLVTQADLAVNKVLIAELPKLVFGASVISEESDKTKISKYTFVIDPIDGTHTFAKGLDDWGVSIQLIYDGDVIYSIIIYPNANTEYYYAINGMGAFDDHDNKIQLKELFSFKPTIVCAPSSRRAGRKIIEYVGQHNLSFKAYGSATYAGYTIFRGGNDLLLLDQLGIWDVIGVVSIAEEIGLSIKWITPKARLKNNPNIKDEKHIVIIHKPDFPKEHLNAFVKIATEALS